MSELFEFAKKERNKYKVRNKFYKNYMTLGLEICALHQILVKEISTISLEEETSKVLALLVGGLRARIKRGIKKIKMFNKGQIGCADVSLTEGVYFVSGLRGNNCVHFVVKLT